MFIENIFPFLRGFEQIFTFIPLLCLQMINTTFRTKIFFSSATALKTFMTGNKPMGCEDTYKVKVQLCVDIQVPI